MKKRSNASIFFKAFLYLAAFAFVFTLGENFGVKLVKSSEEYKSLLQSSIELRELQEEHGKLLGKLNNLIQSSESKKSEELLTQIIQLFLFDLALKVENKDAIIEKHAPELIKKVSFQNSQNEKKNNAVISQAIEVPLKEQSEKQYADFATRMYNVIQGKVGILEGLKKLELHDLSAYLKTRRYSDNVTYCSGYIGRYSGSVIGNKGEQIGKFYFDFQNKLNREDIFQGKITWIGSEKKINLSHAKEILETLRGKNSGVNAGPVH